jgi:diketogulonate reductase-like aldo/keto reductase
LAPGRSAAPVGEFGWGEQDDKASIAAIHRALELGVNWIDTAAVYGRGHSEEVVAAALSTWSGLGHTFSPNVVYAGTTKATFTEA